jgi:predicted transcriptional regulator
VGHERFRLSRELEELHRKLSNARLSVVEHEDLRNENLTLEASRRLLLQR